MSLTVTDAEGKVFQLGPPEFSEVERTFSLQLSDEVIKIPYLLPVELLYSADAFEMQLFVNTATRENDIFRVYEEESGEIIGWLFPIQALLSVEHDYASDQHFLPCALVAFRKLLQGEGVPTKMPISKGEQLSILDFYNENDIILLLAKNQIQKIKDFDIRFYLPDLYKYGYRHKDSIVTVSKRISKFYGDINKNLKLRKISEKINNNSYIYDLFTHVLDEDNVVHVFLSLYQVIEIIIFDIFKGQLKLCLDDYSKLTGDDCSSFFEIGEKLNSIKSEKNRIVDLFSCTKDTSDLQVLCNNLLQQLSIKTEENAAKALYSVRSNLVHAYRLFSAPQKKALENVVEEFIGVVVDIIVLYR